MKNRTIAMCVGVLLLVPAIWSQVSSTAIQSPSKIGTISLQTAIVNTAEGRQASAELQSQFAPRSAELQKMQKQIEDLRTKLQSGPTLSEAERGRLQREEQRRSRFNGNSSISKRI